MLFVQNHWDSLPEHMPTAPIRRQHLSSLLLRLTAEGKRHCDMEWISMFKALSRS